MRVKCGRCPVATRCDSAAVRAGGEPPFGAISRAVRRISSRQPRGKRPARESRLRGSAARLTRRIRDWFGALGSRIRICRIGQGVAVFAGVAVAAVLVLIIGFILVKGLPYLVRNPSLIWGRFEFGGEKVTILPAIITTLYAVGSSLLIAVPVGIMTAVFLNEYARRDNPLIRLIRSAIDISSGVPSIVYGLFGMITFVKLFGGSSSIPAGLDREHDAAALPSCARRRSPKSVPDSMRRAVSRWAPANCAPFSRSFCPAHCRASCLP